MSDKSVLESENSNSNIRNFVQDRLPTNAQID